MRIATSTRLSIVAALCAVSLSARLSAAPDLANTTQFDIPANTPLSEALIQWANRTGMQIMFASQTLGDRTSPPLNGSFTARGALASLLQNSGLSYSIDGRTVTISVATLQQTYDVSTDDAPLLADDIPSAEAEDLTDTSQVTQPSNQSAKHDQLAEVIVTGTHIRGIPRDSSPVISYDREHIDKTGASTVEDFMRTVPQNFASIGSETTLNSGNNVAAQQNIGRGSSIDLRGVGAGATLVLINGHRLAPAGFDGSFVDVSLIPLSAVERVDVLTEGASAIYGADAVAGVVNFVLRSDFQGAETSLRAGTTTQGGANQYNGHQLLGQSWGSGHAMLAYEYNQSTGLNASSRDFIPDLGGPYQIVPSQRRNSVLLSADQEILPSTSIYTDALFSRRAFEQTSTIVGISTEQDSGHATQASAVIGARFPLVGDWRADVSGEYARESDTLLANLEGYPVTEYPTNTQVLMFEARADGAIAHRPQGDIRASFGTAFRREEFEYTQPGVTTTGPQLGRNVLSGFGEIFIPLSRNPNSFLTRRTEITLAARYDSYRNNRSGVENFSATSPEVSFLWAPFNDVNFRASFAKSFRVAPISQTNEQGNTAALAELSNPASSNGVTDTLVLSGGNSSLAPEKARSFSVGVDYKPHETPWQFQINYFHINYTDRISDPPIVGSPFLAFSQTATLAPFINLSPTPGQLQNIYNKYQVFDLIGTGATPGAIFDDRLQNISSVKVSGIDLGTSALFATSLGDFEPYLSGSYLLGLWNRAAQTTPAVDLRNTIFQPSATRIRAGVNWSKGPIESSAALNLIGRYKNNLSDEETNVSSWVTLDLRISYDVAKTNAPNWLHGIQATLNVQNLADRDPPHIATVGAVGTNFGYDAMNSSPLGRSISLQLLNRW